VSKAVAIKVCLHSLLDLVEKIENAMLLVNFKSNWADFSKKEAQIKMGAGLATQ